ncbi:MAG: MFS transporter [Methanomassiliicoccus sp.]|nr:MFS transporter [Methanomassiliicoccus sp.]
MDAGDSWARRFFTVWTGQAFSLIGSQLVQFALVWWLTVETGSAIVLTLASVMGILPQVVITPFAGAYVDRWSRKKVMIAADGMIAAVTVLLMLSFALGTVDIVQIMAVLLLRSIFSGFHWPAMQASTSLMVPKAYLARVNGLNEAIRGVASIAAPPLGAVLIAFLPMWAVLSFDVITATIAILAVAVVSIPEVHRAAEKVNVSVVTDLREALSYIRAWQGAVWLIVIFMLINFLINPAFSLLSLLALKHFGGGAIEYAALESVAGLGMIVGGITLGVWGGTSRKIVTCMAATGTCGVGVALIGLLPPDGYLLAILGCLLIGLSLPVINGTIVAIMQRGVPAGLQGRVLALLGSGVAAMSPVGLLLAGPISESVGIQAWFLVGGAVMIITALGSMFVPVIMHIEDQEAVDQLEHPRLSLPGQR